MLFSIIITTYGRSNKIKRAIKSVINQEGNVKYEIIVVDDNGQDTLAQIETEKIIEDFKDNIIYIKNKKNLGANYSRNVGIKNSKGEYICFLDDDDEFLKNKLETLKKFIKSTNADFLYSKAKYINEKTKKEILINFKEENISLKNRILFENCVGSNSFVCIRRETLLKTGMFDEKLLACQDWDLWIRLIYSNVKVEYIDEKLVNYYINDDEKNRISNNNNKVLKGHIYIYNLIKEKYLGKIDKKLEKKIKYIHLKRLMDICYEGKKMKEYRKYFFENYSLKNYNWKEYIKFIASLFYKN